MSNQFIIKQNLVKDILVLTNSWKMFFLSCGLSDNEIICIDADIRNNLEEKIYGCIRKLEQRDPMNYILTIKKQLENVKRETYYSS